MTHTADGLRLFPSRSARSPCSPIGPSSPIDQETKVDLVCGSGPTIRVGASTLQTRISATVSDLLQMREIKAEPCDDGVRLSLSAGETRVVAAGSSLALPTRLSLVPDVPTVSATPTFIRVDQWSATQRRLHLDPHAVDRVMAVRENANAGWQARRFRTGTHAARRRRLAARLDRPRRRIGRNGPSVSARCVRSSCARGGRRAASRDRPDRARGRHADADPRPSTRRRSCEG